MSQLLLLLVIGLAGGFLAGLIGIGGGAVYVLVLPYLLVQMGYPSSEIVQLTIANSIFGTMCASFSGSVALVRQGQFYKREVLLIGSFASLSSLSLLYFFVNTSQYQRDTFNLVIIGLMILIAGRTWLQTTKVIHPDHEKRIGPLFGALAGGFTGVISALSGLGGGTILIPVLNSGLKINMRKTRAISLGVIFITSFFLTGLNLMEQPLFFPANESTGYIVWPLALTISAGALVGSPFGVYCSSRLSDKSISYIFITFVSIVIIDKTLQML